MTFKEKLIELNACESACLWVGNKTAQESWDTSERGDWMLWLMKYSAINTLAHRRKLIKCICEIAERSLKYLPKEENRPAEALKLAFKWADGEKVTKEALLKASDSAYAAYIAEKATYANLTTATSANAVKAAHAAFTAYGATVTNVALAATNATNATNAAANVAYVADAAANATEKKAQANIIRKYFKMMPKLRV
jgi:hypothetical protein